LHEKTINVSSPFNGDDGFLNKNAIGSNQLLIVVVLVVVVEEENNNGKDSQLL
jgi:hypothetical protein